MSGFEIFLLVLACIIALIVLILSVPVHVSFAYTDKIYMTVRYLFIKFNILPVDPNKPKKPKKEKKPKEDKPTEEKKEEETKEKKPNPIMQMVKANGYDGMMEVLGNLGHVLGLYGGKLLKSIVFDEIEIYITVGTGDAASTAIKYGKTCEKVYPFVGFLCSNNVVKRYDAVVEPDFLANHSEGEFNLEFHLIIRKIINATLAMAVRLVFKVLLKFLSGAKKNKQPSPAPKAEQTQNIDSGKDEK
ncbi:MAG: DUF2953 domain-containing protein [Faecalibacterium sp.]|nr:DUF2953 domain-containing protein [Ruminococcus sp.]MCM1392239.1 DUF2953 domain-containing protein [Ruminococcus sp.]MCM1484942.1 DUF2953 domain-containing protein [Faecalibacterium sp.]